MAFELGAAFMAARDGDLDAHFEIGFRYEFGIGVRLSRMAAEKWYEKAALSGHVKAQAALGRFYYYQNNGKAVEWLLKAAQQGDCTAQYLLGECYSNGCLCQQDYCEAAKWYREAAEQGCFDSRRELGWLYIFGRGVEQDEEEGRRWHALMKGADVHFSTLDPFDKPESSQVLEPSC